MVHNHGTEEGEGVLCPERTVDKKLVGNCMTDPAAPTETPPKPETFRLLGIEIRTNAFMPPDLLVVQSKREVQRVIDFDKEIQAAVSAATERAAKIVEELISDPEIPLAQTMTLAARIRNGEKPA